MAYVTSMGESLVFSWHIPFVFDNFDLYPFAGIDDNLSKTAFLSSMSSSRESLNLRVVAGNSNVSTWHRVNLVSSLPDF